MIDIMHIMPALFIGHGSPMNAIEINEITAEWKKEASTLPQPKAIVMISAHWQTVGTKVTTNKQLEMIYDFYGFPEELYRVMYPAPGAIEIAEDLITHYGGEIKSDQQWGLDHGAWSVLVHLFPQATIPVIQLSLDRLKSPEEHYRFAQKLMYLREQGVLVVGSGNIVHNLGRINFSEHATGATWAVAFDEYVKNAIRNDAVSSIVEYRNAGESARLSVPTDEHFLPLLYILALRRPEEKIHFFAEHILYESLSMTSLRLG